MRRFVTLVFLLFFTVPFGISISGCSKSTPVVYCNGGDSGPVVGQLFAIALQPKLYGVSLNYAQQGQISAPSATDCKGTAVSTSSFTYGTTDMTIADVQPTTGKLCAGTWNRNTGGGIADYTTCNPTNKSGTAYVTASAQGATSNPIAVYVHPVVTSVVLGSPSTDCIHDPATNCSVDPVSNQCVLSTATGTPPPYNGNACLSQGTTGQLAARVYNGQQNISCIAGHLTYTPLDTAVVTIDQSGIATAQTPGSTIITSNLSNASSSAGFFSTCPPKSITLAIPNSTSTNVVVNQNFAQPITATVVDTNGVILTGVNLSFQSTTPTTLPAGNSTVTPIFPGAGSIVAVCQPPTCNQAPSNQIGLYGNGKPIFSNPIGVTTPGTNSTVLYIASTQSQFLIPVDFTTYTGVTPAPVRLPYVPTSMVISDDGSTIYMGTATELMVFSALTNGITKEDPSVRGNVLAVSPDGNTVVITDPSNPSQPVVWLYSPTNGIQTSFGGLGTHAEFTPDSTTVYITAGNQLLVHSNNSPAWTTISASTIPSLSTPVLDVAITVPDAGAFFAGATTTARGACPATTVTSTNGQPSTTNIFYPDAGVAGPATDRLITTNDGKHAIGVTATPTATLTDLNISSLNATNPSARGQCPPPPSTAGLTFATTPVLTSALSGITATTITGVAATSDSSTVFVTYTGTGGKVPFYTPAASGPGTLGNVTLSTFGATAPVAPVAGVFSSDNTTFYTGTSGDNLVHILTKGTSGFQDTTKPINPVGMTIAPGLPGAGATATPNLLVQRPRKQT